MSTPRRERDRLRRFLFQQFPVRGVIARLDESWREVLRRRDYPAPLRRLLGEAVAAAALLHATLKNDATLTLQITSAAPERVAAGTLRLLVVQCSSRGGLRALARWHDGAPVAELPLAALCPDATLTMTVEPTGDRGRGERYQGVVALRGDALADALDHYFAHSEQLPTLIRLSADARVAAGFMLQQLPPDAERETPDGDDGDGWNRVCHLAATLADAELTTLPDSELVRRLFHEETLRLFAPQPLRFRCSCSRERTAAMLTGLGEDEIVAILAERGEVEVDCEFCGQRYRFDPVDARRLFTPPQPVVPSTPH